MYQLKKGQESFTPVEGPLGMRTFKPGESYDEIPPGMEGRFETIGVAPVTQNTDQPTGRSKMKAVDPLSENTEEVK
jgi:hypothetical protein